MEVCNTVVQLLQVSASRQQPNAIQPVCFRDDEACIQSMSTSVFKRLALHQEAAEPLSSKTMPYALLLTLAVSGTSTNAGSLPVL